MPWWGWLILVIVVGFVLIQLIGSRVGAQYGSEEDFKKSGQPHLDRAAEYHRVARISSEDPDKLQRIMTGLDWELRQYRKWAERSGVAETQTAIEGAKLIEHYKDEVRRLLLFPAK